jgi:hypothetical protein
LPLPWLWKFATLRRGALLSTYSFLQASHPKMPTQTEAGQLSDGVGGVPKLSAGPGP